jgi:dUTP pyrophosphatase
MPLDIMGQLYTRSSVWRSLAWVEAGVMDAGYEGAVGAALVVANAEGIWVSRKARLAQMAFHRMEGKTEGYQGVYQGSKSV